jgi:tellurite resistance protein
MEKKKADEFLKAFVSAYVWVASVDGGVRVIEMHKYENAMIQSQFVTQFDFDDMRHYFKYMVRLFANDYDTAARLAKSRIKSLAGQGQVAQEIVRLCRAAAVGDGKIAEAEEIILKEITAALGIAPDL